MRFGFKGNPFQIKSPDGLAQRVKKSRGTLLSLLAGSVLASAIGQTNDLPTIYWVVTDFPPYEIQSGLNAGNGIFDQLLQELIKETPGFRHKIELVSFQRREAMMHMGLTACATTMMKTAEREQFAIFSDKVLLSGLPVRLVTTPQVASDLRSILRNDHVDLAEVLADGRHHLVISGRRTYGPGIDAQLERIKKEEPLMVRQFEELGGAPLEHALSVLTRGQFDLTLGYTSEVEYLRKRHPEFGSFVYYPLQGSDSLLEVRLSCSKTEDGRKLIAIVNQSHAIDRAIQTLQHNYEGLLTPDEMARYRGMLKSKS